MSSAAETAAGSGFRHAAVFYDGADGLRDRIAPFVEQGVALGEPVLVAELPGRIAALRAALGSSAHAVTFVDMSEAGGNPASIIPLWREFLAEHPGRAVRGVGEPAWAGRRDVELEECQLHEALLNVAFDDWDGDFQLLCPYDVSALPADVLTGAMRTHPEVTEAGRLAPYGGAEHARQVFEGGLPARPADVPALDFGAPDLALVRLVVRFLCEGARLSDEARDDLVLAVHELACNSVEHGDGTGVLRAWSEADSLVLEISDKGVIDDPLVGRERVLDQAEGGRGIWMANHLCDLVQVRSSCAGTTVRLHTWT